MSKPSDRIGSEPTVGLPKDTGDTTSSVGTLGAREVVDLTKIAKHETDKVPHQKLYEGGSFNHRATVPGRLQKFFLFLQSLFLRIFPFLGAKQPKSEGKDSVVFELIALNTTPGITPDSPEVQAALKKLFPDMKKLREEWAKAKKEPEKSDTFAQKLDQTFFELREMGEVPFTEGKKEQVFQELQTFREDIAKEKIGNPAHLWEGHLENIRKFPIETNPHLLMIMDRKLKAEIDGLEKKVNPYLPPIEHLTSQLSALKKVQAKLKGEANERLEEVKRNIDGEMTGVDLQQIAKQAQFTLPQKAVGEQIAELRKFLVANRDEAKKEFSSSYDQMERLRESEQKMDREKTTLEKDIKLLETRRLEKEQALPDELAAQKAEEKASLERTLRQLEPTLQEMERREKELIDIQEGKAKGLWDIFARARPLSEEEKKELARVRENISLLRPEVASYTAQLQALSAKYEKKEVEAYQKINQQFLSDVQAKEQRIRILNTSLRTVAEDIKEVEKTKDTASQRQTNYERLLNDLRVSLDRVLRSETLRDDCVALAKFQFVAEAYHAFQNEDKAVDWPQFVKEFVKKNGESIESHFKKNLESRGIPNGSAPYKSALQTLTLMLAGGRTIESKLAEQLGLKDFLAP